MKEKERERERERDRQTDRQKGGRREKAVLVVFWGSLWYGIGVWMQRAEMMWDDGERWLVAGVKWRCTCAPMSQRIGGEGRTVVFCFVLFLNNLPRPHHLPRLISITQPHISALRFFLLAGHCAADDLSWEKSPSHCRISQINFPHLEARKKCISRDTVV